MPSRRHSRLWSWLIVDRQRLIRSLQTETHSGDWLEKVTCAIFEPPSGHLDRMCHGFLQRQQMDPTGCSFGPCPDILGAVEKPDFDLGSFLASPASFFLQSFSLCPNHRHHVQEIERSLLSRFLRLKLGSLAVITERTVSGPLTDSILSECP